MSETIEQLQKRVAFLENFAIDMLANGGDYPVEFMIRYEKICGGMLSDGKTEVWKDPAIVHETLFAGWLDMDFHQMVKAKNAETKEYYRKGEMDEFVRNLGKAKTKKAVDDILKEAAMRQSCGHIAESDLKELDKLAGRS